MLNLTVSEAEIAEAGGVSEVVVSTGATTFAAEQTITLTFTGSAEKDTDYRVSTEQLTLPAREHSVTATVTAQHDTLDEDDETVLVTATNSEGAVGSEQRITITDDDTLAFEVSVDPDEIGEADTGSSTVTVSTGAVTFATDQEIELSFDGTAVASDYTVSATTLTLVAGATEVTATVTAVDDTLDEDEETILVTVEHDGAAVGTQQEIRLTDDDTLAFEVSVDPDEIGEADTGSSTVTVSTGAVTFATDQEIELSFDGTAVASDYTVSAATLTLVAGATEVTATVTAVDDTLDEDEETILVTVEHDGAAVGTQQEIRLTDDDTLAFEVSVDPDEIGEADTGSSTVTVSTGAVTFATDQEIELSFDGTAVASDYTVSATTLTLVAGATEVTATVTAVDDTLDEDEETILVTVEHDGAAVGTQQEIRLTDDDTLAWSVDASPDVIGEVDTGSSTVTVSTGAVTFATDQEIELSFDGTAVASDYTVSATTLTLVAGATEVTATVTAVDDTLDEDEETILVTAEHDGGTVGTQQRIRLTDDDTLGFTVEVDPDEIGEADTGSTTVTVRTGDVTFATDQEIVLSFTGSTATETADYTVSSKTLTLEAGETEVTATVTAVDDTLDEEEETILVTAEHDGGTVGTQKTMTITDDDPEPDLSLTPLTQSLSEGGGDMTFTVSLGAASAKTVTVAYESANGTAEAGTDKDYEAARGTLTFNPDGDRTQDVDVTILPDELNEDDEEFTLKLHDGVNATLAGGAITLSATGTITDDDPITAAVTADPDEVPEGDPATFIVEFTGGTSTADVEVVYTVTGTATQGVDYTAPSERLTIVSGNDRGTISIVTRTDDVLDRGETIQVALSSATTDSREVKVDTMASAATTITDDSTETVSIANAAATEGDAVGLKVTLSGKVARAVEVSYATSSGSGTGTAVVGTDYTETTGTLTFSPGQSLEQTISVTTEEDELNEADETFTVTLTKVDLPAGVSLDTSRTTAIGTIEDDDPLKVKVTADADSVREGDSATFTVAVTGTSTADVVVDYAVADTVTAGVDYNAPSGKLTIAPEAESGQITIETLRDGVLDRGEQLEVSLVSASTVGTVTVDSTAAKAVTTITDESTETVSVKAATAREGDPPEDVDKSTVVEGGPASFVVELSGAVASIVKVSYQTADGTSDDAADARTDYTAATDTLTFNPNAELTHTISVATIGDDLNEATETFMVTLTEVTMPDGVVIGTRSVTGTITDNDELTATVTADATEVDEGQSATFTVTLTADKTSTAPVVVGYSVGGSATSGVDYTAPEGTLTVDVGISSGNITIETIDEGVLDPGEMLEVSLISARTVGSVTVDAAKAVTKITDGNTVTASVKAAMVLEGDSPESVDKSTVEEGETASFVVVLSGKVAKVVELPYTTTDDTGDGAAIADTDYTTASATLTFSPEETSKTVAVATTEDALNEDNETFTVTLTSVTLPDGVSLDADATTATGTIENDDGLTATVKRVADNVPEGAPAEFAVELTGGTSTADVEVTYTWASTGTAGTDYTAPSGLLTITKPNSSGTIAIVTLTDSLLDPGETLSVTLTDADTAIGTATVGTPATATTTIAEEGTVTVSVKAEEVEDDEDTQDINEYDDKSIVEEGGAASFVVELSGAAAETVIVGYATSNETGAGHATAGTDYTAVSDTLLTFTSGQSLTQTIAVTTDDDTFNEPTEEFTVTLTGQDLPDLVSIGTSSTQGTITDNDGLTAAVTAVDASVDEGETAEFTVTLTGGTSTADVLVTYTVGGTATSGDDYTAPTDLKLTIGTGVASGTISIEILTDTVVERDDETLEITLTGATTSTRTVAIDADKTTVTTMINNTTTASPSLRPPKDATSSTGSRTALATRSAAAQKTEWTVTESRANSSTCLIGGEVPCPREGEPVTLPVYLVTRNESNQEVAAELEGMDIVIMPYVTSNGTADAGADYTSKSGTLTFTSTSDQSLSPCETGYLCLPITLETIADNQNEDREIFMLTLEEADLPDMNKTDRASFDVPILDDDPITASVSASAASVIEGQPVSFTVTLSGGESTADVTIWYSVSGTATRGDDYRAPSGTLTIAKDSTSRRFTVTIQTIDDLVVESEESLVLQLSDGSSAGSVRASGSDTVTILDNDTVTVSVESATTTEGEPASFVVKLSRQASDSLEVSYQTADVAGTGAAEAGTDYTAASGTLTFAPGDTSKTVAVPTLDDELNEADETFTLTLSAPNLPNWATLGTDGTASATGTIEDDDMLAVAVTADADIVAEGDPATFTVALTGGTSTGDVVVVYTVDGSATASDDYTAPDGTLTIRMGETSGIITIATRTDEVVESDETLEVTLDMADSVGKVEVDPTPAMTTIIDPPAVTIKNASATESDGEIVFEVELSAASIRQVTVDYRTVDGTATAPEDYGTASGSLTFAAGQTSGSITIRVVDDALDEADRETFTVLLSAPENARFDEDTVSATGAIMDDDDPPAISIHDASAKESAKGGISFRVSLSAASGREVAVSYRTEDGTAKAGEDYGATDGTLTIAAGRTDATIRVTLENDFLEEEEETFTVRLLDPVNAELADSAATGTIIDDDVSVAQVWLARFGRTVATHVVDAVGERLNEAAGRSSEAAIAGHPLQPAPVPAEWQESTPIPFRTLAGHDLVAGSSFRLASSGDEDEAADGGSKWTGWGRGAVTRLAGKEPKADLLLRGTIATGTAGVDYDWGGVLTGLAMAYTGGGGNFKTDEPYLEPRSGTAESWLLSAHPYARVSVVDGLEVWGLLGYGLGMMTLTEDASVNTDIRMMMGAAGVRGILLTPVANGGFGVAVSSDGFAMRANADAAGHQPAVEADAVRGRLLVEGSYDAQLGDGSVLIPMVEAGMRYDAGHAEEGFGAELGGGVRYVKPEWGLTATANGRFVLAHQDRGFQEWGLRGSLQWSPGAGGLGPSLGVNTSVGTAASGVQRLWSQGATPIPAAPESGAPAGRLDARFGYGMSVDLLGTDALLMPYAGLTLADGGTQAYRVGGRANLGSSFSLSLEGQRRESSGNAPAHGITLSGSLHW